MKTELPIGAIMAGGMNSRYGAIKALATVGGHRIIDRARAALATVTPDIVLMANDAAAFASVDLATRPDPQPGLGALGGIYGALKWAEERGAPGIIAVACDMPFLSEGLLARILELAPTADIVAPESTSRRGVEPLCAWYSITCIPAVERAIARGDTRMISFHGDVTLHLIPFAEVKTFGDPDVMFMNVNTPEERELAEATAERVA